MSGAKADIRAIFCEALDRNSPEEVARYLDKACVGDTALRAQVEELLSSHRAAGQFLAGASASRDVTDVHPVSEARGTQIGSYKLLEQVGEGGFGVVYMAEQTQPLRRKVALKILKPGMDSRQVIGRSRPSARRWPSWTIRISHACSMVARPAPVAPTLSWTS
jgi:hypothetical protein